MMLFHLDGGQTTFWTLYLLIKILKDETRNKFKWVLANVNYQEVILHQF